VFRIDTAFGRALAATSLFLVCAAPEGLRAQGAQALSNPQLPLVRLQSHYFSRQGRPFMPVGAHWVPAKAELHWPIRWDPAEIEADFRQMKDLGFNTVRLDLFWAWFEPRPGDYNPEAFRQLDFLISLAHRYGLYLHPSLFIGGEVGEAYWDVPWRHGRNPQSDPEMLRLETNHAAELAHRYRGETAILAWDLTDEPPFWIEQNVTDAMAINWTRLITGALRKFDPQRPLVVGTSMEDVEHGPFRPDNIRDEVNFFSVHPYTIYAPRLFPDPMLSERGTWGAAFETALSGGAGRPVMVQELGSSSAQYDPERAAAFDRASLYSALGAGANGFLLWCYTDAAPENFRIVPYLRSPHETQFGLTTWDRRERPRAREFRQFEAVVARMNLDGLAPAPAEAGILVPEEWARPSGDFSTFGLRGPEILPYVSTQEGGAVAGQPSTGGKDENLWLTGSWLSSFILAHRAGMSAGFPREYSDWSKYRVVLLPSPLTSTEKILVHVRTDFWEKARHYVEKGGFLYASLSADSAIPEMERLFGARLQDHEPVSEVTLKVVTPFGSLRPGDTFHYTANAGDSRHWAAVVEVSAGQVIAVDGEGRPALIANSLGKGRTLLSTYPLETYLATLPSAFEKHEETHRIYRAFREWTGVQLHFAVDNPSIQVSCLEAPNRGYVVMVNHGSRPAAARLTSTSSLDSLRRVTPEGLAPLPQAERNWQVDLEPYGAAVIEWTQPGSPPRP